LLAGLHQGVVRSLADVNAIRYNPQFTDRSTPTTALCMMTVQLQEPCSALMLKLHWFDLLYKKSTKSRTNGVWA